VTGGLGSESNVRAASFALTTTPSMSVTTTAEVIASRIANSSFSSSSRRWRAHALGHVDAKDRDARDRTLRPGQRLQDQRDVAVLQGAAAREARRKLGGRDALAGRIGPIEELQCVCAIRERVVERYADELATAGRHGE
jgi:hypothetical protein